MTQPLDNLGDIQSTARSLLRRADVDERLPTPVDDIVAVSGLTETDDYVLSASKIMQAPQEIRHLLRSAGRKIKGVLDRRERILHVSPSDTQAQRQFVRCHETMHDALPWQRDLVLLGDTHRTLAPDIEVRFEREANQGGAELLFQLDLLERIGRDHKLDITTPVLLAELFGLSIHATFRRWIETHRGVVMGIVIDPRPVLQSPLTFKRYEVVESSGWRDRYGERRIPARLSAETHPFLGALAPPWAMDVDTGWALQDRDGQLTTVRVQSFCNTYRTFLLLWLPGKESLVARHRRRPTVVVS